MKKIEFKEMEFDITEYQKQSNGLLVFNSKANATTFDLVRELIKVVTQDKGIGDLDEQRVKMKMLDQLDDAITNNQEFIEYEDEHAKILAENLQYMKYSILDKGLIEFQELIKSFK